MELINKILLKTTTTSDRVYGGTVTIAVI